MSTNHNGGYSETGVLGLLRTAHQAARELLTGLPVTGWKWRRPPRDCPDWCAQDHRCTVRPIHGLGPNGDGYQLPGVMSEHRSPTSSWSRPWGRMVAARAQRLDEPPRLELTVQVELSGTSGNLALAQGVQLPLVIDQAITTLLAELEVKARVRAEIARHHRALPWRWNGSRRWES